MGKKKCYVSGKISGLPWGEVERNFSSAVLRVFRLGMTPVSPLNNGVPRWMPWIVHMVVDVINLLRCSAVAMQGNWIDSQGAKIEYWVAKKTGKEIIFLEDWGCFAD